MARSRPRTATILSLLHILSLSALGFMFALPCWGGGLDLYADARAAERAGKLTQAVDLYSRAMQVGDLSTLQLADIYYRRGSLRAYFGENNPGLGDFSKSIELNPDLGQAYSLRGYLRGISGQYESAERDYLTALDLAKHETWENYLPWVLQHYADLWRRRGQFETALEYCQRALKAKEYAVVYFRRAWVYLDMGQLSQARADLATFEREMRRQEIPFSIFLPDEREAIARLRAIPR